MITLIGIPSVFLLIVKVAGTLKKMLAASVFYSINYLNVVLVVKKKPIT